MKVKFHSAILRYEGSYASLSAFMLSPAPKESDKESMQLSAEGTLKTDGDALSLSYREEDGTPVSLDYTDGSLKLQRGMTKALFTRGKSTSFSHFTGYGALENTVYTLRLDTASREGKRLVTLTYLAFISGMVQKNTMMWKLG